MRASALVGLGVVVFLIASPLPLCGGIKGSAHDFSAFGWSQGEVCVVCHTPHHADTSIPDAPLWNHQATAATYQLYSSPTLNASLSQPTNNASKLCLSCHDGTIAVDSFGGRSGGTFASGSALIGTDLRGTHPIGFVYDAALAAADGGLHNPESTPSGLGGSITADLLLGTGRLECASCHDVHDKEGNPNLLRKNNAGSALCLTCHDK